MNTGRIFIPQEYGLEYCKSPQAIVFDTYVRIYFSYCVPDGNKLISRVGFVDFDKSFKNVLKVSKTVMSDGKLGTFDEHGIFPFSPFRDNEGQIKAITSGWTRRVSVSTDSALGLAVSDNQGETFKRYGDGPILTATLREPFLIADGFVVRLRDRYIMYYIFGTEWGDYKEAYQPERTYKIGVAESVDLINWKRNGHQIIESKFEREAQALPSVIYRNGYWHMAFCFRDTVGFREDVSREYKIGYAYSTDMYHWVRDDSRIKIKKDEWCNEMQCYPNLFEMNGEVYMLYNGNHFAKEGFGIMKLEDLKK